MERGLRDVANGLCAARSTPRAAMLPTVAVHAFASIIFIVAMLGCQGRNKDKKDSEAAASNFIAVIDLNVVAKEIGALDKINESLIQRQTELESQLDELKVKLDEQYEANKSRLGENLNEKQQSELEQMLQQSEMSLALQAQAADEQLGAHHNRLKLNLLNQVRPIAYEVAQEQGMSIVLTTSQIYAFGPSVNITHQVIQRINAMNAEGKSVTAQNGAAAHTAELKLPHGGDFMPQ